MAKEDQSKLVAILSYITIIGWVIALVMNMNNKTDLGSFHIRQALLLMLTAAVLSFIPVLGWVLQIIVFILWLMGLLYAIQGNKKMVPVLGQWAQDWFKGL